MIDWQERKKIYNEEYYDGDMEGHYRSWWWIDFAVWGPRARAVYEALRPQTVLVCGCAKGSLVKFLHGVYAVDALGFDLSRHAIETTPYPEIANRLLVLDLATQDLPYDERQFDLTTCYDFLEHNDDEHIDHVVSELLRITKKHIVIRSPIVGFPSDPPYDLIKETTGLPFDDRIKVLSCYPGAFEWERDGSNLEHPNTRNRAEIVSLFTGFTQVMLDSYYYDIMMGNDPNARTPVLPFYDTIVLKREIV